MNELTTRKKTRQLIVQWFEQFSKKDRFTTDDTCRYVNRYLPHKIDTGTIRREMRFLRDDGLINYKSVGPRRDKIIELI